MKQFKLLVFPCFMLLVTFQSILAEEVILSGIKYSIEDGQATVVKNEVMPTGSILIPKTITTDDDKSYAVTKIGKSAFYESKITSVTIEAPVTIIDEDAFSNCTKLVSITLPNTLETIGDYAFNSCSKLTSIAFPNSLKTIGAWVFNWAGLTSITIPSSVTSIGEAAFIWCEGVTAIHAQNSEPIAIPSSAFNKISTETTTLYVPTGSRNKYLDADIWSNFMNIVEEDVVSGVSSTFAQKVSVCGNNAEISVKGAELGSMISVYTTTGNLVNSTVVTADQVSMPASKGIYLVKVGTRTFKVAL